MNLNRTLEVKYLRERNIADHGVIAVKGRRRVDDTGLTGCRVWVYGAGVAVAHDGDVAVHVAVLEGEELEVDAIRPVEELNGEAGHHGQALKLGSMASAVAVLESVNYRGQDAALPWPDVLFEEAVHNVDWMQVEISAYLGIL